MMSDPKQAMERHVAAWNARDADAMPWSADAEWVSPGVQLRGRDEILAFERGYWEAFPDARLEIVRLIAEGALVATENRFVGTHTGVMRTPDGDVPPTGRRVELGWMAMMEVRGDEVVSEHFYWDQAEFLTQLGLAAALAPNAAR